MDAITDLFDEAQSAFGRGDLRETERICRAIIHIEPKYAGAWNLLGRCLLGRGRVRESVYATCLAVANQLDEPRFKDDFEDALEHLGRIPHTRFWRGRTLLETLRGEALADRPIYDRARRIDSGASTGSMSANGRTPIHLICAFTEMAGTETRALGTYDELREHADVQLWSQGTPDSDIAKHYRIKQISRNDYPRNGTFVIYGVWWRCGKWIRRTAPERIILHLNTLGPVELLKWLSIFWQWRERPIEIVYPSKDIRTIFGLPGPIEASSLDLSRFAPPAAENRHRARVRFTVGRLSRTAVSKHHPDDHSVYRAIAAAGDSVRIMGGGRSARPLTDTEGIEILDRGKESAVDFLHSLDCLFYRTGEFYETWGRVVSEAMACGLPVVCHRNGGYRNVIDSGESGFLFDTTDDALEIIRRLREDEHLRRRVGDAARAAMEKLYSPTMRDVVVRFYLG